MTEFIAGKGGRPQCISVWTTRLDRRSNPATLCVFTRTLTRHQASGSTHTPIQTWLPEISLCLTYSECWRRGYLYRKAVGSIPPSAVTLVQVSLGNDEPCLCPRPSCWSEPTLWLAQIMRERSSTDACSRNKVLCELWPESVLWDSTGFPTLNVSDHQN